MGRSLAITTTAALGGMLPETETSSNFISRDSITSFDRHHLSELRLDPTTSGNQSQTAAQQHKWTLEINNIRFGWKPQKRGRTQIVNNQRQIDNNLVGTAASELQNVINLKGTEKQTQRVQIVINPREIDTETSFKYTVCYQPQGDR